MCKQIFYSQHRAAIGCARLGIRNRDESVRDMSLSDPTSPVSFIQLLGMPNAIHSRSVSLAFQLALARFVHYTLIDRLVVITVASRISSDISVHAS